MSQEKPLDVFISCGESSGDMAAANLLKPLQKTIQAQNWAGVIGPDLKALGVVPLKGFEGLQVMGFTAVLRAFNQIKNHMHWVESTILNRNPKVVLLVDYPGFHLRLAKRLRKKGFQGKIIQYICPSVWAWKRNRLKTLKACYDEIWGILPFEKKILISNNIKYLYTGNPSFKLAQQHLIHFGPNQRDGLGLFPGSRPQEIRSHLPQILKAAEAYEKKYPGQKWFLCVASKEARYWIDRILASSPLQVTLVAASERWQVMTSIKAAIAVSGTVCLELALHHVPTVAVYACGLINYVLAKYLFRIKLSYFTLPNLILERAAFREIIGASLKAESILDAIEELSDSLHESKLQQAISELEGKLMSDPKVDSLALDRLLQWTQTSSTYSAPCCRGHSHCGGRT